MKPLPQRKLELVLSLISQPRINGDNFGQPNSFPWENPKSIQHHQVPSQFQKALWDHLPLWCPHWYSFASFLLSSLDFLSRNNGFLSRKAHQPVFRCGETGFRHQRKPKTLRGPRGSYQSKCLLWVSEPMQVFHLKFSTAFFHFGGSIAFWSSTLPCPEWCVWMGPGLKAVFGGIVRRQHETVQRGRKGPVVFACLRRVHWESHKAIRAEWRSLQRKKTGWHDRGLHVLDQTWEKHDGGTPVDNHPGASGTRKQFWTASAWLFPQ